MIMDQSDELPLSIIEQAAKEQVQAQEEAAAQAEVERITAETAVKKIKLESKPQVIQ